jgi:hypothetical protein
MLGGPDVPYTMGSGGAVIFHLPETDLPCDYAWAFKVELAS